MSPRASRPTAPVAVVTGGSRGIGRSLVEKLAADGRTVVFTHSASDADAAEVETACAATGGAAHAVRLDVTAEGAAAELFDVAERHGPVRALVNNAGVTGPLGRLADLPDADLRRVLEVNLVAVAMLCREAARRWTPGGADIGAAPGDAPRRIVNLSSVAARTGSPHEYVVYAASKAGVEALTRGLATELAPHVLVNAVAAGTTDTTIHARAGDPDRARRVAERIPLRRPARPEEIADAVCWLLSPGAGYVTGSVLDVTGGL